MDIYGKQKGNFNEMLILLIPDSVDFSYLGVTQNCIKFDRFLWNARRDIFFPFLILCAQVINLFNNIITRLNDLILCRTYKLFILF